jgi:hypothetical protein
MGFLRPVVAAAVCLLAFAVAVPPAYAARPSNDTYAGRQTIAALPFSQTLDTTEATTDAIDAEANADCGAPATEASVWYSFTAPNDTGFLVDVSGSSYSAGVIVVTGSPGAFTLVTCGPGAVLVPTETGVEYAFLAFGDVPGADGGTLEINVIEAPPAPEFSLLTIDPVGQFVKKTGEAVISGTYSCSGVVDFAEIDVELRQRVGRVATIHGFGFTDATCDGAIHDWSVVVTPDSGMFKGGQSASIAVGFACGPFVCGEAFAEQVVKLSGR